MVLKSNALLITQFIYYVAITVDLNLVGQAKSSIKEVMLMSVVIVIKNVLHKNKVVFLDSITSMMLVVVKLSNYAIYVKSI